MRDPARNFVALIALTLTSFVASAAKEQLECAVERGTEVHHCVLPSQIREANGLRQAPLYKGGPIEVERTPYTVAVNCDKQVMLLKDRQGVNFGGGTFSATQMSRDLGRIICSAVLRKR